MACRRAGRPEPLQPRRRTVLDQHENAFLKLTLTRLVKQSPINMKTFLKILLFFILILVQSVGKAQENDWKPKFNWHDPNIVRATSGDLSNFLGRDVPEKFTTCKVEYGILYFKVDGIGKVDTLQTQGNLDKQFIQIIYNNLKKTEGYWILPENSKVSNKCNFIYPFFIFGKGFDCSPEIQDKSKTLKDHWAVLSRLNRQTETRNGILLAPRVLSELSIR